MLPRCRRSGADIHGRKLAAAIPAAKLIEYKDIPHAGFSADSQPLVEDIEEFVTGHRTCASEETDRVLATVLFTDIVDSTSTVIEIGDWRWHELLDLHDRLARQVVERYRGKVVKSTGDGMLATFDGPGRGVRCALAFGAAAGQIGLPLRAGLHTGEIEVRGDDVGGIAVHVAARVMGPSDANEVFGSCVVTDLVAGAGLAVTQIQMRVAECLRDRQRGTDRNRALDRLLQHPRPHSTFGGRTPDEVYAGQETEEKMAA